MIIVLTGPTAVGKTSLALKLAKRFNGFIINADSRQIYKELQIGTARPSKKDIHKTNIPHFLFGHRSINEKYSVFDYKNEVLEVLEKRKEKEKEEEKKQKKKNKELPFLVGGTGLYIDSVIYDYELKKNRNNNNLDNLSKKELQEIIGEKLFELNESDRNNPRRLIRFIQKDYETFKKGKELKHLYLVLYDDFENIEGNIQKRIEKMFKDGLIEENKKLKDLKVLETIGYREFNEFFENKITLEQLKEKIYINTRKYAKRQITWFKRNKNAIWIKNYEEGEKEIEKFLKLCN